MELTLDSGNYSLRSSLVPSFVSSLYENQKPDVWIKVAGYLGGSLRIEQMGRSLIITSTAKIPKEKLEQLALLETGLWHDEFERGISKLPLGVRDAAEVLAEAYPGVRIPIAPRDFDYILIAVLLSKRANYRMVRRWCREIWKRFPDNPSIIASTKSSILREITPSYQLKDAARSIRDLKRILIEPKGILEKIVEKFGSPKEPLSTYILSLPPEIARPVLLSAWGIGPKVADSVILSTFKASHFIPCDVHLKKFVTRLSLTEYFTMPNKTLCKKFLCGTEVMWGLNPCHNSKCLRAVLRPLGDLGGWLQTLIYLHGKDYCKSVRPRCNECPMKGLCADRGARRIRLRAEK